MENKIKAALKKTLITVLAVGTIFTSTFGFVGCGDKEPDIEIDPPMTDSSVEDDATTEDSSQTPPDDSYTDDSSNTQQPPIEEPPIEQPPVEDEITFEEFLTEHQEVANNFAIDVTEKISYKIGRAHV